MKILFLCGSAEPGKDGVGDYTRRLCGELIRTGHQAQIISLCDKQVVSFVTQTQLAKEIAITVRRIPKVSSNKQRLQWTQEIFKNEAPDWISLQYVPYSFNTKGLPFWLPGFFKELKGAHQTHIMFHEVWVGISVISPFEHKVTGFFQRFIAKQIINKVTPISITTSNILYQLVLDKGGIIAETLPLFSNISKVDVDLEFKKHVYNNLGITEEESKQYLFAGVFGSIYPEADIENVLNELLIRVSTKKQKLVFVSFGRIGADGKKEYERLEGFFSSKIKFVNCGELSEERVSTLLQLLNIGISCTPSQHVGKSGVFAAMKFHGLEVIMSSGKAIPEYEEQLQKKMPAFINRPSVMWGVENVANDFISIINN
jgi:hypothetical protein